MERASVRVFVIVPLNSQDQIASIQSAMAILFSTEYLSFVGVTEIVSHPTFVYVNRRIIQAIAPCLIAMAFRTQMRLSVREMDFVQLLTCAHATRAIEEKIACRCALIFSLIRQTFVLEMVNASPQTRAHAIARTLEISASFPFALVYLPILRSSARATVIVFLLTIATAPPDILVETVQFIVVEESCTPIPILVVEPQHASDWICVTAQLGMMV
mmetsp:Transcript_5684/g.21440  ORF Transcript_5684/g.21440 Transcript_5684/m.21440 type:complete len:215 (+) Transcript_5684:1473-2117(+)